MTAVPPTDSRSTRMLGIRDTLRSVMTTLSLAMVFLALGLGYGLYRFGSIPASLAYLRGERLLVDEPVKSITGAEAGSTITIRYNLSNLSNRPVMLVGMKSSCTCTVIQGLPTTLAASETRVFSVTIRVLEDRPNLSGSILLYTDSPESPQVALAYQVLIARSRPRPGD